MLEQLTREAYQVWLPDGEVMELNAQQQQPDTAAEHLESGAIIYFPRSPFQRSADDTQFLLSQHQKDASYHKNIAYRPLEDRITGLGHASAAEAQRLRSVMSQFHKQAVQLFEETFPAYKGGYKIDFASYRPIEEKGRKMRLRARNDLLHVDSFPTRPVNGDRILRVFENINPSVGRVWRTSETFETLAEQFYKVRKAPGDLDKAPRSIFPRFLMKALGLKASSGSAYDKWMLDFHNFLKENSAFQSECRKTIWDFPPGSAWIVYTDMASHSVLSGQYALEQTFIVSQNNMVTPEKTPINILRRLYGQPSAR